MRYQKHFVQNKVRVLSGAHSRTVLGSRRQVVGHHIIHKKDGSQRVWKGKRSY
ncbi:MAG: hypothetical protein RLZZ223_528 [Candidatus Parcubacteria bacterium]|jgi:hypothetical protein